MTTINEAVCDFLIEYGETVYPKMFVKYNADQLLSFIQQMTTKHSQKFDISSPLYDNKFITKVNTLVNTLRNPTPVPITPTDFEYMLAYRTLYTFDVSTISNMFDKERSKFDDFKRTFKTRESLESLILTMNIMGDNSRYVNVAIPLSTKPNYHLALYTLQKDDPYGLGKQLKTYNLVEYKVYFEVGTYQKYYISPERIKEICQMFQLFPKYKAILDCIKERGI